VKGQKFITDFSKVFKAKFFIYEKWTLKPNFILRVIKIKLFSKEFIAINKYKIKLKKNEKFFVI